MTLDTGALIALERGKNSVTVRLARVVASGARVTVPAVVLIEWWRDGFSQRHRNLIAAMTIEPTTERIAKAAGAALTNLPGVSVVDAAVMASAALRGDVVWTSDLEDLTLLQPHFPGVRVFSATAA